MQIIQNTVEILTDCQTARVQIISIVADTHYLEIGCPIFGYVKVYKTVPRVRAAI